MPSLALLAGQYLFALPSFSRSLHLLPLSFSRLLVLLASFLPLSYLVPLVLLPLLASHHSTRSAPRLSPSSSPLSFLPPLSLSPLSCY